MLPNFREANLEISKQELEELRETASQSPQAKFNYAWALLRSNQNTRVAQKMLHGKQSSSRDLSREPKETQGVRLLSCDWGVQAGQLFRSKAAYLYASPFGARQ
jgi:hypothetical protein